uniref:CUB domain-containing protein n=1 Tax=Strigamia maritima TaxID=126957 RepID=T1JBM9_STRMM
MGCGPGLAILAAFLVSVVISCRISEFFCDNGRCIGLDRFCDGKNDCGDKSDEPRQCTRCNRTFYGDRHKTYQVSVDRPKRERLPYYCQFTFIAGGGELGDLVELAFEQFSVGRLLSYMDDGCPDAHIQMVEHGRPPKSAGGWCGFGARWNVYYSETNNLTLIVRIFNLTESNDLNEFTLRFNFRFLSRAECVTRYGPPGALYHRGEFIPGTVCDRSFQDCDWQVCKVQSPNFPGIYPRNVTCHYHITQRTIPDGQHAMIVISQKNEDKLSIKTGETFHGPLPTSYSYRREKRLLFGNRCEQDYIRVFDGSNASDPFLIKFCRSGALSDIISSGPDLSVEFRSSAFDQPEMNHFELDVRVIFLPEDLIGARLVEQRCDWSVSSRDRRQGVVYSLQHFTQPNTTCLYHFRGSEHEFVWFYFVQYFPDSRKDPHRDETNLFRMKLWERSPSIDPAEDAVSRLVDEIHGDKVPRLCVHARSFPDLVPVRPCKYPDESYVTNAPELFLRYSVSADAQLDSLKFIARYEFVNLFQYGDSNGDGCHRLFRSGLVRRGVFASPQNVFFFGRGGSRHLECSYTFLGSNTERVRLLFRTMKIGRRRCSTSYNNNTNRYFCQYGETDESDAEIRVYDQVWNLTDTIPLACVCNVSTTIQLESLGSVLQVNFTVRDMNAEEDFDDFNFEAVFEFVSAPDCRRHWPEDESSGNIKEFVTTDDVDSQLHCPWFLAPPPDEYVYLRLQGTIATDEHGCETANRIVVSSPGQADPIIVVCPESTEDPSVNPPEVEIFSRDWNKTNVRFSTKMSTASNALVLEFLVREAGNFAVKWLKVGKLTSNNVQGMKLKGNVFISAPN